MSEITMLRASVNSKRRVYCFECEENLGEGDQCIAVQTPIAVKVYYIERVRKSVGSNLEARCERCGRINLYPLDYWEEKGEPIQTSEEFVKVEALNPHTNEDNTPKHSNYDLFYKERKEE